jgi:hypothetical protein
LATPKGKIYEKPNDPKSDVLKKQGCINRRPEQVKYEMLRQALLERQPIGQNACQFGFSRPSFYQALANFKQNGLLGLMRDKPGPAGHTS